MNIIKKLNLLVIAMFLSSPAFAQEALQKPLTALIDILTGAVGISICVLAIAGVGFMMLAGRIEKEKAVPVVAGIGIIQASGQLAALFI
jgi:type IV secretory pathway VirB2 component (pilin)